MIRAAIAGALALAASLLVGISPAHAEMTARGCDWGVSGWSSAKVCVTVTYFQPTASKYEITRVRVEATDIADTKRVEYGLNLWNNAENIVWQRDGTLNQSNGWDKVYTPDGLRVSTNSAMTCWGNAYFDVGGAGFFTAAANL